jgi:rare lipoprotein A
MGRLTTVLGEEPADVPRKPRRKLARRKLGRGHQGEMTRAHRTRAFGSVVTVTYAGRSIHCRVNDRGHFVRGQTIDVSLSAARALGMMRLSIIRVSVELVWALHLDE